MLWGTSALGLAPQTRDPKGRPWPFPARGGLLGISGKIEDGLVSKDAPFCAESGLFVQAGLSVQSPRL